MSRLNGSLCTQFSVRKRVVALFSKVLYSYKSHEKDKFMMTSLNRNIFRVTGPLCGEFTCHWWIPLTKVKKRRALMFSLICAWINGWVSNLEAGYLRRHRSHYDITVNINQSYLDLTTEWCGVFREYSGKNCTLTARQLCISMVNCIKW